LVITGTPAQSSVAVAIPRSTGPQLPTQMSGGTNVKVGLVVSTTVTVCVSVLMRASERLPRDGVRPSHERRRLVVRDRQRIGVAAVARDRGSDVGSAHEAIVRPAAR
jgi:hypothetical protein